jgi:hypothetical protein
MIATLVEKDWTITSSVQGEQSKDWVFDYLRFRGMRVKWNEFRQEE